MNDNLTEAAQPAHRKRRQLSEWVVARPWRVGSYPLAALLTAGALALRLALAPEVGSNPALVLLVVPVMLSAYFGGIGPGLLATALAAIGACYFLLPPLHSFLVASPLHRAQLTILILTGVCISVLTEALHRSRQRVEADRNERAALQEQMATLAATAPGAIFSLRVQPDGTARFLYASPGITDIFGLLPEDLARDAAPLFARLPPDQLARLRSDMAESSRMRATLRNEGRVLNPDRGEVWAEVQATPALEPDGAVVWHGFVTDITERKRAERALRDSELRFRALIEHSSDSIALIDASNTILYLSPAVAAVEGYAPEELIGTNGGANTHPDDLPYVERVVQELMAHPGKPIPVLWRRRHKDGRWLLLEGFATNLLHDPAVRGIVTNYHDVTERKRAEETLASERALLRTLIDALPDVVFTRDTDGRFLLCNAATLRHLGAAREKDVVGKSVFDFYPRELAEQYHADDLRAIGGEAVVDREEPSTDAAGRQHWYLTIKVPLHDAAGRTVGLVGISRDITERKRLEESLRRTQKMEALGTLAGGIAHDFNNLLLAITGNTKLAMEDLPADHAAQESLAEIGKASARAADLVRRILTFTRHHELERDVIRLEATIDEALKLLRATLPAMIEIKTTFAPDVPPVAADATQIHQVIMNLATNATHAIGAGRGQIEVSVDAVTISAEMARTSVDLKPQRYVRLSVSDNGCGMDKATLERIFDPFFTTKPVGKGTGLGLSAVHGIMRSHEGAVTVYSQPGKGTTFRLYFPATSGMTGAAAVVPPSVAPGGGERVLYIDDEEALVVLTSRILRGLGYQVTAHTDPRQAVQAFRSNPHAFDVVVTDLSMPGLSGFDVAGSLFEVRPDIPILMTSGYLRPEDQDTAARLGIRALILKPNTVDELGQALHRLFTGPAGA